MKSKNDISKNFKRTLCHHHCSKLSKKSQGVFLEKIWEKYLKQEKHRKVSFHFSNPWAAGIGWGVQDMRLTFISNNIQ